MQHRARLVADASPLPIVLTFIVCEYGSTFVLRWGVNSHFCTLLDDVVLGHPCTHFKPSLIPKNIVVQKTYNARVKRKQRHYDMLSDGQWHQRLFGPSSIQVLKSSLPSDAIEPAYMADKRWCYVYHEEKPIFPITELTNSDIF